ncbi:MAG: trimethylamine methyltransferase family protein, partial [Candidatus Thorarchaeota archaeon]
MTSLRFLSTENINALHDTTLEVLDKTGVCFESEVAQEFLREAGCIIEGSIVKIPESLVSRSLEKAPNSFDLYNLEGSESFSIGSDTVIYNPASSAVYFKDRRTRKIRHGTSEDVKQLVQVVDALDHIKAQSTALIASDVPEAVSDFHRLFISLKNSIKPIVTGAFRKDGVPDMIRLLEVIVGDTKTLAKKPVAIFDCCPVSPLVWSDLSCQNLIDCAESGIPSEIVPAPLMGATSPTTLNGTIVQTNVEVLSGIVLAQVVSPGAPIIYGGAPADFDMKYATARFGAIESMIVACASSEMGKHYGVPTHAYIGSSDSK